VANRPQRGRAIATRQDHVQQHHVRAALVCAGSPSASTPSPAVATFQAGHAQQTGHQLAFVLVIPQPGGPLRGRVGLGGGAETLLRPLAQLLEFLLEGLQRTLGGLRQAPLKFANAAGATPMPALFSRLRSMWFNSRSLVRTVASPGCSAVCRRFRRALKNLRGGKTATQVERQSPGGRRPA